MPSLEKEQRRHPTSEEDYLTPRTLKLLSPTVTSLGKMDSVVIRD
jgi:hypothetical protein